MSKCANEGVRDDQSVLSIFFTQISVTEFEYGYNSNCQKSKKATLQSKTGSFDPSPNVHCRYITRQKAAGIDIFKTTTASKQRRRI